MRDMPLQTRSLHSTDELTPYLDAWRKLAAGAPMRSPEWLLGWWDNFAASGDALHTILVFGPENNLIGLAPLYLHGRGRRATLRVLGAADNCTHHSNWLFAPGWATRVGEEVARSLLQRGQDWHCLLLEAIDADAEAVRATMEYLVRHGCLGHQRQINSCWKIHLPDTWEDYLKMLSRSLRKRCRKLQRQFLDSGRITIHRTEKETEFAKGFQVLLDLHAARWGTPRQPLGVFSDKKFRTFHKNIAQVLLGDGQLRLAWLECEGIPLAVEYQFFDEHAVYAYQAGLNLSMQECSPGKLSMMAAIQFAIDRGCETFDLLGGDEPYKSHWRAVPTVCHDLRVWRHDKRGFLEWSVWHTYARIAQGLKPIVPDRVSGQLLKLCSSIREARVRSPRSER